MNNNVQICGMHFSKGFFLYAILSFLVPLQSLGRSVLSISNWAISVTSEFTIMDICVSFYKRRRTLKSDISEKVTFSKQLNKQSDVVIFSKVPDSYPIRIDRNGWQWLPSNSYRGAQLKVKQTNISSKSYILRIIIFHNVRNCQPVMFMIVESLNKAFLSMLIFIQLNRKCFELSNDIFILN